MGYNLFYCEIFYLIRDVVELVLLGLFETLLLVAITDRKLFHVFFLINLLLMIKVGIDSLILVSEQQLWPRSLFSIVLVIKVSERSRIFWSATFVVAALFILEKSPRFFPQRDCGDVVMVVAVLGASSKRLLEMRNSRRWHVSIVNCQILFIIFLFLILVQTIVLIFVVIRILW